MFQSWKIKTSLGRFNLTLIKHFLLKLNSKQTFYKLENSSGSSTVLLLSVIQNLITMLNAQNFPPPPPHKTPIPPAGNPPNQQNQWTSIDNSYLWRPYTQTQTPIPNPVVRIVINPRVGNIEGGIAWTKGSNIPRLTNTAPRDVRCFWPTDFWSMQEQDKLLKQGVLEDMHLTLVDKNEKGNQTVSSWIKEIKFLIKTNQMNTVLWMFNGITEVYMFDHWGALNKTDIEAWITRLKTQNCQYNLKNLRLSGFLIRNSISNKVRQ